MGTSPDHQRPRGGAVSAESDTERAAAEIRSTLALLYHRIRQTKQLGELTLPESSVLSRLRHGGPATSAALARLERISPQSVGATVAALEARGLITRSSDPSDGRRVILSLTSAGDATVDARRSARDEQFTRALTALGAEERARLVEVMPILRRLAEEL